MCPYCQETKTEFQKWDQTPDENQTLTEGKTVTRTVYTYVECKQEKCGHTMTADAIITLTKH